MELTESSGIYFLNFEPGYETCDLVLTPIDDVDGEVTESIVVEVIAIPYVYRTDLDGNPILATAYVYSGDVVDTKWIGFDPGDGETNFEEGTMPEAMGGGDRIFVERNSPEGRQRNGHLIDQLHDRIHLEATLDEAPPQGKVVEVHFRIFDPDHYSDESDFNSDGVGVPDDNIASGDHATVVAHLTDEGFTGEAVSTFFSTSTTTTSARIGMRIHSGQPTNNFIGLASASLQYVQEATLDEDGRRLVDPFTGDPMSSTKHTQTLTVWRRLYLEIDSMGTPDLTAGPAPSHVLAGNVIDARFESGFTVLTIDKTLTGGFDRFKGGTISLFGPDGTLFGNVTVDSNSTAVSSVVTVPGNFTSATTFQDLLADDSLEIDAADMIPDTTLFRSKFEPACVLPIATRRDLSPSNSEEAEDTFQHNISFSTHVSFTGSTDNQSFYTANLKSFIETNRQSHVSHDFWTVYLAGVFNGNFADDNDKDAPGWTGGISVTPHPTVDNTQIGVFVFRETVRDALAARSAVFTPTIELVEALRVVAVHEVGHLFKLDHPAQSADDLMSPNNVLDANDPMKVDALRFSADDLRMIVARVGPMN